VSSASHEYFHVWNVKRIRPFVLGPFDYENAQFQPSLWVAEGWTNYYGDIGLLRAGLESRAAFYTDLGNQILGYNKTPARKWVSARMASISAPYWDGAPAPMPVETWESFISYYSQGEALALLLDIEIRSRTGGRRSLDDALRNLKRATWDAPSTSYYLQGRGYTEMDVERAVSEAAGVDLHAWFDRFVGGTDELPFAASLAVVGMRVTTKGEGADMTYVVDEDPAATPAQVALRDQWLAGTTSGAK
jgi:predicted metalloprotease with PDZ domain